MATLRTLFSGGELFGIGACQASYTHVDGYEIDPKIAAVARLNGYDVRIADVCDIDYASLVSVDHLHVSPSCKHASQANVNAGETDEDIAAADAICRAIQAHRGDTFTLENVWGYRNFESFERVLFVLYQNDFSYDYWHLNSADYGVPQTRKRLILIARRGEHTIRPPHQTHRKGGDMFHERWNGWYAAIADIIHTLPETTPAPWQAARLPAELRETMLFANNDSKDHNGNSYGATGRSAGEPALTIGTNSAGWWKAYLIGTGGYDGEVIHRENDEPCFTVADGNNSQQIRAYLLGGGNTQLAQIDSHARADNEPMFTISASDGAKKSVAAYLLDGDNARAITGDLIFREATEPAMIVRGGRMPQTRAYVERWVRLTVQALGRFQTVPDDYKGLTPEINGNGVPCLFARRIMESLR